MDTLVLIAFFVLILNIPFGYWRAGTRKFSRDWYLAIHIPVPIVLLFRLFFNLGWGWESYAVLVTAYFAGQLTGKIIRNYRTPGSN